MIWKLKEMKKREKSMKKTSKFAFVDFLNFINENTCGIEESAARLFWDNYYPWDEFRHFPDEMKARTKLSIGEILALESAYESFLYEKNLLEIEDFCESLEWIKQLVICLEEVGEENFISSYHCHPNYLAGRIFQKKAVEESITIL